MELADVLEITATAYIDHPVVDATGLDGAFDFTMGWTSKALMQPVAQPNGIRTARRGRLPTRMGLRFSKRWNVNWGCGW